MDVKHLLNSPSDNYTIMKQNTNDEIIQGHTNAYQELL